MEAEPNPLSTRDSTARREKGKLIILSLSGIELRSRTTTVPRVRLARCLRLVPAVAYLLSLRTCLHRRCLHVVEEKQ